MTYTQENKKKRNQEHEQYQFGLAIITIRNRQDNGQR